MKKTLLFAGLAAATLALAGCNKETDVPHVAGGDFEVVLTDAQVRTANDGLATKWTGGDQISVFHALSGTDDYKNDTPYADGKQNPFKVADEETGVFKGELLGGALEEGQFYDWYVLYPYNSYLVSPAENTDGRTYIGSASNQTQHQNGNNSTAHLAGGSNTACFPLYGIARRVAADQVPQIAMKQVASVIAVQVTNTTDAPISVQSVDFTAPEAIVGNFFLSFASEPVAIAPYEGQVSATATLSVQNGEDIAAGESAIFYMGIKPFTASAGSELTLSVTGSNGEVSVTKTLETASTFAAGKIKTLNINYDKVHVDSGNEWVRTDLSKISETDEFVIVGTNANGSFAMTNDKGTSSAPVASSIAVLDGKLKNDPTDDVIWVLTKGANSGEYAFSPIGADTYLYATNANNGLRVGDNDNKFFKISEGYLMNVATSRYVGIYNSADWRCYTTINSNIKDQTFAFYVKYEAGTVTPGKVFTAELSGAEDGSNLAVAASATSATIIINADDDVVWTATPSDGLTLDLLTGSGSATVAVSFPANTDPQEKNYSILVGTQTEGVENDEFELSITQAAYETIGEAVYQKVTSVTSGKKYILAAVVDGLGKALTPLTGNYGYAAATDVTILDGKIGERHAALELTFTAVDGGYSIVQPDGKFIALNGTYNSFNVYATAQQAYVWTVSANDDGTVDVKNVEKEKHVVFDRGHANFAAYATINDSNVVPGLYEYLGEDDTPAGPIDPTFTVPATLSVEVGQTAKINVTTNTDGAITYTSDAADIASVAADGTVTGVAVGTANIIVAAAATSAYNAVRGTVAVTVTAAQSGSDYGKVATITSGKKYLIVGGKQSKVLVPPTGTAAVRPGSDDVTITDRKIAANATTNAYAVTITETGGAYNIVLPNGNYLVYASSTNVKGSATASDTWTVSAGEQGAFRFIVSSTTSANTVRALAYRGGTTNVFGAYSTGNINGTEYFDIDLYELGAEPVDTPDQPTVITTSISMPNSHTVYVGETFDLNATSNVEGVAISYESEDSGIATVSTSGVVTGVAEGSVKIYARIAGVEGKYTEAERYCNVTVSKKPEDAGGTWKATALASMKDGDEFVLVSTKEGASYAMSNDNGTSSAPAAVAVTVADNAISNPASNLVFVLKKTDDGYEFQTADGEKWLYVTNANNGVRVGSNDNKVFTLDADSGYLVNSATSRYLGVYSAQDWRSYTSINNNIKDQTFTFFVKN